VDAVPNRRPEAVSLTVDASRIVFSKAGDDRVELAFSRPLASSKRAAPAALMWLKSEATVSVALVCVGAPERFYAFIAQRTTCLAKTCLPIHARISPLRRLDE
jgi:hypothetical protein